MPECYCCSAHITEAQEDANEGVCGPCFKLYENVGADLPITHPNYWEDKEEATC